MEKVNYTFWNDEKLLSSFNEKDKHSFFRTETELLNTLDSNVSTVLDIGCSCGRFLELLRAKGYQPQYTGIDISEPSIEIARRNYPESTFIHANALSLSGHKTYDLINATGVYQHEPLYTDLQHKMIALSNRYVMWDLKIANISKTINDVNALYCKLGDVHIPMIVLSWSEFKSTISELSQKYKVSLFGYPTPPNGQTFGDRAVLDSWVSCGVLVDKHGRGLNSIHLPTWMNFNGE